MGRRVDDRRTLGIRQLPGAFARLARRSPAKVEVVTNVQDSYKNASAPLVARSREAITRFFDGFDLVDPGLVHLTEWRSDEQERAQPGGEWLLAGVGRKR